MGKRAVIFAGAMLLIILLVSFYEGEAGITMSAAMGIEGTEWLLVEVSGNSVAPLAGERRPFLKFDAAKKQATGFAGCNNFFGDYERNETSLKFGPVGSTRMSCPDLQISLETEFLKALDKTGGWEIRDNVLLLLHDSEVIARLTADLGKKNTAEVTGTVWQWMQTLYNDDRKVVPADPKNFAVQFLEDGALSVKADCNQKGGTYSATTEERRISIKITHSTMAACPEGSLEDEFVRGLTGAAIYFIKNDDLYIDLKYDSGTMRFSKQKK